MPVLFLNSFGGVEWMVGDQAGSKESPCSPNLAKPQYGLNIISNVWTGDKDEDPYIDLIG